MHLPISARLGASAIIVAGLTSILIACNDSTVSIGARTYTQTNLVADAAGFGAPTLDVNLVNPWGIAFNAAGVLYVANNGTGTATLYNANGAAVPTIILIPGISSVAGTPTGVAFNSSTAFAITGGPAQLIFVSEDGSISAWNGTTANAQIVVDRSLNLSVYKGAAIAANGGANFLYATDFRNNSVDVFNSAFQLVNSFTDPDIPAGFAPFGISNIDGKLYVTFAKQSPPDNEEDVAGVGNGYVDIFNPDGTLVTRFASTGTLNSPWAVVQAPATGFGSFSGDILIGNFGDGQIGAYTPTGAFAGLLRGSDNDPIVIDGLWGLAFGPNAGSTTLYFAAGPNDETRGLVGTLRLR